MALKLQIALSERDRKLFEMSLFAGAAWQSATAPCATAQGADDMKCAQLSQRA